MASSTPSRRDVLSLVLPVVSAEDRDRLQLARDDYAELAADLQEHCSEADAQRYVRALQLEDAVDALSRAKGVRAAFLRQRCRRALRTERPWRIGFERSRLGAGGPVAIAFREERRSGGLRAAAVWIGIGLALTAAGVVVVRSIGWHAGQSVQAARELAEGSLDAMLESIASLEKSLSESSDPMRRGQLHGLLGDEHKLLARYWEGHDQAVRAEEHRRLASRHYRDGAKSGDAISHVALGVACRREGALVAAIDHFRSAYSSAQVRPAYRKLRLRAAFHLHRALVERSRDLGFQNGELISEAFAVESNAHQLAGSTESRGLLSWILYNGACLRAQLVEKGLQEPATTPTIVKSLEMAIEAADPDTRKAIARSLLDDPDLLPLRQSPPFQELVTQARSLLGLGAGQEGPESK